MLEDTVLVLYYYNIDIPSMDIDFVYQYSVPLFLNTINHNNL